MPIAMIVSSMRCALRDLREGNRGDREYLFEVNARQMEALIDELEKHDGAAKREAANDA